MHDRGTLIEAQMRGLCMRCDDRTASIVSFLASHIDTKFTKPEIIYRWARGFECVNDMTEGQ